MISIDLLLLGAASLLLVGVLASKASGLVGVPALLLFIGVGMLAGSEGPGGIHFENYFVAQSVGVTALAIILFGGGLQTRLSDVRPVLWQGVSLSTLGVIATAGIFGCAAKTLMDFSWIESLLLGAIVSSTDAAAVFGILRSRRSGLKPSLQSTLELESGSNDPMAVFLTVALLSLLSAPDLSVWSVLPMFARQMIIGAVAGYLGGKGLTLLINRIHLEYEGLYPVLTLAAAVLVYSLTASLGGSGFVAVYLAGILAGNSAFIHKTSLLRFHDGLGWLMQITMFLTLGLLVFPSHLVPVAADGTFLALFLLFVARPISVFIALARSPLSFKEKSMIAWVGLRGATPIILATFPFLAGVEKAEAMFNLVFFTVLISVLIQGPTLPWIARWLKMSAPLRPSSRSALERLEDGETETRLNEFQVAQDAIIAKRPIVSLVELGFPKDALIVLLTRGRRFVIPRGETRIEPEDTLWVLSNPSDLDMIRRLTEASAPTPGESA